jgi:hypothetical protein
LEQLVGVFGPVLPYVVRECVMRGAIPEAAMSAGDTEAGKRVALQADDTFEVVHGGTTLKFKFHPDARAVELISAEAPVTISADDVLEVMTGPSALRDELLRKLSRADSVFVSKVISDENDLDLTLPSLTKLSEEVAKHGGIKPVLVLRVAGKGGPGHVELDRAMRTISNKKLGLDAHIVSMPDMTKKF